MRETKVMVYNYDELSAGIQEDLVQDELKFLIEADFSTIYDKEFERAQAKADEMRTPWFFSYYLYDELKEEIMNRLRKREYLSDGSIYLF